MIKGLRSLKDYAGQSVRVHLKEGGAFHLKITEASDDFIAGYDDEGLNLHIDLMDIDFIIG